MAQCEYALKGFTLCILTLPFMQFYNHVDNTVKRYYLITTVGIEIFITMNPSKYESF